MDISYLICGAKVSNKGKLKLQDIEIFDHIDLKLHGIQCSFITPLSFLAQFWQRSNISLMPTKFRSGRSSIDLAIPIGKLTIQSQASLPVLALNLKSALGSSSSIGDQSRGNLL